MMALPLLIVPLIFVIAGAVMLRRGLRGELIDDHPICRRCGFDLVGLPEGVTVCSECGADLTAKRAIRHGHRKRRPVIATAGAILVLLVVVPLIILLISQARELDVYAIQPTWLLAREAKQTSASGISLAAWNELRRRAASNEISAARARELTEFVLALQADRSKVWKPAYGDFVEAARATNLITQQQWITYARQAPSFTLLTRPKIRRGDAVPACIGVGGARCGNSGLLVLKVLEPYGIGELVKDRKPVQSGGYSAMTLNPGGGGSIGWHTVPIDRKAATTAPLGPRELKLEVEVEMRDGWGESRPPLAKWTQQASGTWEMVAGDAPTVELFDDPSVRPQVEQAMTIRKLYRSEYNPKAVNIEVYAKKLPVPVAYDVFFRAGEIQEKLTTVSFSGTVGESGYHTGGVLKRLGNAQRVDVIFRPNADVARGTLDMTRIWNGEIVIKDVPIGASATQPAG